jgi:hypothetical protein
MCLLQKQNKQENSSISSIICSTYTDGQTNFFIIYVYDNTNMRLLQNLKYFSSHLKHIKQITYEYELHDPGQLFFHTRFLNELINYGKPGHSA